MKIIRLGAVLGSALAATSLLAASPATAASGSVDAIGGGARTWFGDADNIVIVSDRLGDYHGAVGWIEIKQADGSWNQRPATRIYVGAGEGSFQSIPVTVNREAADVRLVSCLQDGASGSPWNCNRKIISGS
ncbi:hypothetical protein [Nocardioides sp. SLBN-35]|uniref:hypothetical protein n=1 Tax=Nocardioides sp. SLBN-35 TaxID=2768445 RepID=UPI00115144A2|nr:hypothetical protein [Nocardioides sp. SLBN-35]TQK70653.1 hypothetical protein FBY23_2432 [Nocardioides sp. SLBN-35]